MEIPQSVKNEAKFYISQFGENIEYLGKYKGQDAYFYHLPDDLDIGFPEVYLYSNGSTTVYSAFDALNIIDSFSIEDRQELSHK